MRICRRSGTVRRSIPTDRFRKALPRQIPPNSQQPTQIHEESPGAPAPPLAALIELLLGLAIVVRFKFSFEFADDIPFTRL